MEMEYKVIAPSDNHDHKFDITKKKEASWKNTASHSISWRDVSWTVQIKKSLCGGEKVPKHILTNVSGKIFSGQVMKQQFEVL